jgi:MacB-like periplasmic core domain
MNSWRQRCVTPIRMMRQIVQDLTYAARVLRKSPGFTAVAIVSLAIGIGANSAMFSMADALLLRPLGAPRSGELVAVNTTTKSVPFGPLSWRDYADFRDTAKSVRGLAAYQTVSFGLSTARDQVPQLVYGMVVSGNFFSALEVQPALGRGFRP